MGLGRSTAMQASGWRGAKPRLRLVAVRRATPFSSQELEEVEARFDSRAPDSPWCGFGTVGDTVGDNGVSRLVLFTLRHDCRCLRLTRYSDGRFELATANDRVVETDSSLGRLLSVVEGPGGLHRRPNPSVHLSTLRPLAG